MQKRVRAYHARPGPGGAKSDIIEAVPQRFGYLPARMVAPRLSGRSVRPFLVSTLSLIDCEQRAPPRRRAASPRRLRRADRCARAARDAGLAPRSSRCLRTRPLAPASFDTLVKPFLAENCYACHGNKKQKKGLNFETFESAAALAEHPRSLGRGRAAAARHARCRPRTSRSRRSTRGRRSRRWIERELERIDRTTPPDPGRVTARRLNRTEYNNTDPRSARRRHASGRRLPAGRCRATASTTSATCCRCRRC